MSRLTKLVMAVVSALALSTLAVPIADEVSSISDAGGKRTGNWCC